MSKAHGRCLYIHYKESNATNNHFDNLKPHRTMNGWDASWDVVRVLHSGYGLENQPINQKAH